ncbi:MAG: Spermidine/putrescine-binding periplasmic protein [Anaerolineae bacterium]|nr:Spermidine/putrescine-binding periplasmic protein [Anaerolineae bacterium]
MLTFLANTARVLLTGLVIGLILRLTIACAAFAPNPGAANLADELIFYDWAEDIPQPVLDAFTEEFNVKVTYLTYNSDMEAAAGIEAGSNYDVAVLNSYLLPELIEQDLLAEIDYNHVPNFQNIAPNFKDLAYDPANRHSIPFNWGTTGILVRSDIVTEPVTRWADLWALARIGKIALRDEPRDLLGAALKSLGYSVNSENPAELDAALQRLLKIRQQVVFVDSDAESALPLLANGESIALVGWAEDALQSRDTGVVLTYVIPEEGTILWGDSFTIMANSPNKYTAELFLNFLLRPEISAQITNYNLYATPNEAARPFIDTDILNDPIVFPTEADLKNAEVLLPLSTHGEKLFYKAWERFKTAGP